MTFLDTPLCRCELMHTMVLTDQTQPQCAREHDCPPGTKCPLGECFAESSTEAPEAIVRLNLQKAAR